MRNLERVPMTAEQERSWNNVMRMMDWTAPSLRYLWYKLLQNHDGKASAITARFENPYTKMPGVAFTDGQNIVINPDTYFKYDLAERVFIGAHEVGHCIYDDPGTLARLRGQTNITCSDGTVFPYDEGTMQKVMDYRLNAMLVESRIGKMPKNALYDPEIAKGKEGILDVYGRVYKQDQDGGPKNPGRQPGRGNAQGQNGFDAQGVAPPGTTTGQAPSQAMANRNPQKWGIEMAQAQRLEENLRGRGNLPGSFKHMFEEILNPTIPWTDHIEVICKRLMGTGSYDWRKPDRRFIGRGLWLPGKSGSGAGWLVIWGDTSGSIGDAELNSYLGEMRGMLEEVHPARLTVIWCDAYIRHVDEITDMSDLENVRARGVGGRGGTSLHPVMEWIYGQRGETPDMFIGMTDGAVSFPKEPPFPTVWATVDATAKFPYGEVVPINKVVRQ
jgi:hypothetical protein